LTKPTNNLKLTIELVPESAFYKNVRALLTKDQWSALSKQVRSAAYDICQICNSPKQSLDCHEVWHYNDSKLIQKLTGLVALCKDCHMVKHFGFAQIKGKGEQALNHFMKINKLTRRQALTYIEEAFEIWKLRSKSSWTTDVSFLENYSIFKKE